MPCPSKSTAIVSRDRWSRERLDGDVDLGADRSVDAAHRPGARWVEPDQLGGGRPLGATDPAGGPAVVADRWHALALHGSADHSLLPLVELGGSVV